jgi:hypothetical protein
VGVVVERRAGVVPEVTTHVGVDVECAAAGGVWAAESWRNIRIGVEFWATGVRKRKEE